MSIQFGIPSSVIGIIQALIILFLITSEFVQQFQVRVRRDESIAAEGH
jgi:ABC-type uncharacterized transport system permease subunit